LVWNQIKQSNLSKGFLGSGLFPLNMDKVLHKVGAIKEFEAGSTCVSAGSTPGPHGILKKAIFQVLVPPPSECVNQALENAKRPKRRIRGSRGKVLTDVEVQKELQNCRPQKIGRQPNNILNEAASPECHSSTFNQQMKVTKIRGDGNCLFACVAHALFENQASITVAYVRNKAVAFIYENWEEFGVICNAIHGCANSEEYYRHMIADGTHGDHTEVLALSQVFDCCIEVYRNGCRTLNENNVFNADARCKKLVRLNLHNEHYDLIADIGLRQSERVISHITANGEKSRERSQRKRVAAVPYSPKQC
jgi:hypothetical protein